MFINNLNRHTTFHYVKYYHKIFTISNELSSLNYVFTESVKIFMLLVVKGLYNLTVLGFD